MARCLDRLRQEQDEASGPGRFEKLKPFLVGDGSRSDYAEIAGELGLQESSVRVAVHRLRKRFCDVMREEVGRTVADAADVDAEIRWLLSAARGSE